MLLMSLIYFFFFCVFGHKLDFYLNQKTVAEALDEDQAHFLSN